MLGAIIARPVARWKRLSETTSTRRRCSSRGVSDEDVACRRAHKASSQRCASASAAATAACSSADMPRRPRSVSFGPELLTLQRVERSNERLLQGGAWTAEGA